MRKLILSSLLSFGIFFMLIGQDAKFTITVSNDSILLGNHFEVTFALENAQGEKFEEPDFKGFQVVGGPSQSMHTSIINGKMTQRVSWTYYLEPADIGNYFIKPASVETKEGILETQPIEILVVPNPDGLIQKSTPKNQFKEPWNIFGDPFPEGRQERTKPKKKRKIYRI